MKKEKSKSCTPKNDTILSMFQRQSSKATSTATATATATATVTATSSATTTNAHSKASASATSSRYSKAFDIQYLSRYEPTIDRGSTSSSRSHSTKAFDIQYLSRNEPIKDCPTAKRDRILTNQKKKNHIHHMDEEEKKNDDSYFEKNQESGKEEDDILNSDDINDIDDIDDEDDDEDDGDDEEEDVIVDRRISSRRGRRYNKVNYNEDSEEDSIEEDEDENVQEEEEDGENSDDSVQIVATTKKKKLENFIDDDDDEMEDATSNIPSPSKKTIDTSKLKSTDIRGFFSKSPIKAKDKKTKSSKVEVVGTNTNKRKSGTFVSSGKKHSKKQKSTASKSRTEPSKTSKKKSATANKKKRKNKDDSESEFEVEFVDNEEEEDDDDLESFVDEKEDGSDEEDYLYDDDEDFEKPAKSKVKSKSRPKSKSTTAATTKSKSKKQKIAESEDLNDEEVFGKPKGKNKKMSEDFKPVSLPVYYEQSLKEIQRDRAYLDSCGMEATDGIIDKLLKEQVCSIGGLLLRNFENGGLGSDENILKLATACSGTDAPALALILIQEIMEMLDLGKTTRDGKKNKKRIEFEHIFSCENEPFKQAYLARNFDSMLFPDIGKLTNDPPVDVFGQDQEIPYYNLFVAGTSCKNFSMMRSKFRIDIEDKGCSGETFLGACEHLFKQKPKMAIFENVQGAPWAKMSEYITGRLKLSECDESKTVTNLKDKNKDLEFAREKDGSIVVDYVPGFFGVRVGAKVIGYLQSKSSKIKNITWPKKTKKKDVCTLKELMAQNSISKANDTLVLETTVTYCTHLVKVDTKEFGLPQTRNRCYLFVWQPENGDVNDDLGCYWDALVHHLRSPVKHSLESFLLNDDHEIIRRFREALTGPPGRKSRSINFMEPDYWTSASANLPHSKTARIGVGMKDMARPQTDWKPFGVKQLPPHYWREYIDCNNARIIDMLDILHVSALREAESHDSNFSSFYWNLSQSATREKHRGLTPGIAGCITPGGDFFVPHKGRPMLGCEKLLVQGLPYFRLALGNETEVQLGDLAGNAMSLTVVSACMLASITCEQLRTEMKRKLDVTAIKKRANTGKDKKIRDDFLADVSTYMLNRGSLQVETTENKEMELKMPSVNQSTSAKDVFSSLADLANEAVKTSIWCTCETSGKNTSTIKFIRCRKCGITVCRDCISKTSGYQLKSHDTEDFVLDHQSHDDTKFQAKLRGLLPTALFFSKEGLEEIEGMMKETHKSHLPSLLSKFVFCLRRIKRERMRWVIIYHARENDVGDVMGEIRITIGHITRNHICNSESPQVTGLGLRVELTSFLPAQVPPYIRGALEPCAFMDITRDPSGSLSRGHWQVKSKLSTIKLSVAGTQPIESPRIRAGLTKDVAKAIEKSAKSKQKQYLRACDRGEERRWVYVKNWELYPRVLTIANNEEIGGEYVLASCEQTTNMSSLWIRAPKTDSPEMYIIIKPNVERTGGDTAIVTKSINHEDHSSVVAEFPSKWQPSDALDTKLHSQRIQLYYFECAPKMTCWIPKQSIQVHSSRDTFNNGDLVKIEGLTESNIKMLTERVVHYENQFALPVSGGSTAQKVIRSFNAICAVPIQKHAAENKFTFSLDSSSPWIQLDSPNDKNTPFGRCEETIPPRPSEQWKYDEERKRWDRHYESGKAREFRLAIDNAPKPFHFIINKDECWLKIQFSPEVAAHKVVHQLLDGRGIESNNIDVSYRFSDTALQTDPVVKPFQVLSCDDQTPTDVKLEGSYELYERQKKVVTKMIDIERMNSSFEELEMIEHQLPGSTGLSMTSRAIRKIKLRGGVIADAIGAGKTVISIAIILKGIEKSRSSRQGLHSSSATLVVVPPGLLKQWEGEINKFSPKHMELKVVVVYDFKTLQRYSVKDLRNADVVIIPIDILESKGYFENLTSMAKLDKMKPYPNIPTHSGQKELTGARGVWIPATSADPYGGANNSSNQANRNVSAYYTYVYQAAIQKLRAELRSKIHDSKKGVPIEFFEWDRIFVDEIHESLCTTKAEIDAAKNEKGKEKSQFYKEKNRRAGRELLGICIKDPAKRPLLHRNAIFGLTGTPLLDSNDRVIDLANLMGNTYIIGLSSHWRKLEKESSRDIFLENYLEPKQGREVRKAIFEKCQAYLDIAACRNKTGEEMKGIELNTEECYVKMTEEEKILYCKGQRGIPLDKQSLSITPEDFEDISIAPFLIQNAKLESRGKKLVEICKNILREDKHTKIIVFTDGRSYAGEAACQFLRNDKEIGGCTSLSRDDSNEVKNEKISWYQNADATEQDRKRPRVLVLHFEHCAGLNLQSECNNLILFAPLYTGEGGAESDPVSDASTELQAIGRVYRAGQRKKQVYLYKIIVTGPNGEETIDKQILRRNTDKDIVAMATNAAN